jgi:Derlin-2/3
MLPRKTDEYSFNRTIAAAALAESLAVHIFGMPYTWVLFHPSFLWKIPPDLWRLVSSFILTTPGLGLILDPYFSMLTQWERLGF